MRAEKFNTIVPLAGTAMDWLTTTCQVAGGPNPADTETSLPTTLTMRGIGRVTWLVSEIDKVLSVNESVWSSFVDDASGRVIEFPLAIESVFESGDKDKFCNSFVALASGNCTALPFRIANSPLLRVKVWSSLEALLSGSWIELPLLSDTSPLALRDNDCLPFWISEQMLIPPHVLTSVGELIVKYSTPLFCTENWLEEHCWASTRIINHEQKLPEAIKFIAYLALKRQSAINK